MDVFSDAEAIAASAGDPTHFGALFDRHATTLYRYFLRRVGPNDADELTGELFRVAFERRQSYDAARPDARPWLYGIATNLIARYRRTAFRRDRAVARLNPSPDLSDEQTERATDSIAASQLLPEVQSAIADLPDGERDALVLFAWEDLSYDEIAAALDVPVGTVRSRINRARGRLRELNPASGEQLTHADVFTRQKERLMSTIAGTDAVKVQNPPKMYPRLAYRDELAALDYLTRVFKFAEKRESRMGKGTPDDHMLAWLEFDGGLVMIGHSNEEIHRIVSPLDAGHATSMTNVEVDNIDEHY
ncbi:MAG: hypothetical protein QOF21_2784, partial [Actinomycetota bacterium]